MLTGGRAEVESVQLEVAARTSAVITADKWAYLLISSFAFLPLHSSLWAATEDVEIEKKE